MNIHRKACEHDTGEYTCSCDLLDTIERFTADLTACRQECEGLREEMGEVLEVLEVGATPLSDKNAFVAKNWPGKVVGLNFSQALERKLNKARADLRKAKSLYEGASKAGHEIGVKLAETQAQLTSLQAAYANAVESFRDLLHQVNTFCETYGEADFETGQATKALASTPPQVTNLLAVLKAVELLRHYWLLTKKSHIEHPQLDEWERAWTKLDNAFEAYRTWTEEG